MNPFAQPASATGGKTYLNVPFAQKDAAKALGARWDAELKRWYAPGGHVNSSALVARWPGVPSLPLPSSSSINPFDDPMLVAAAPPPPPADASIVTDSFNDAGKADPSVAELKAALVRKGVKSSYSKKTECLAACKVAKIKISLSARGQAEHAAKKEKAKAVATLQKAKDKEKAQDKIAAASAKLKERETAAAQKAEAKLREQQLKAAAKLQAQQDAALAKAASKLAAEQAKALAKSQKEAAKLQEQQLKAQAKLQAQQDAAAAKAASKLAADQAKAQAKALAKAQKEQAKAHAQQAKAAAKAASKAVPKMSPAPAVAASKPPAATAAARKFAPIDTCFARKSISAYQPQLPSVSLSPSMTAAPKPPAAKKAARKSAPNVSSAPPKGKRALDGPVPAAPAKKAATKKGKAAAADAELRATMNALPAGHRPQLREIAIDTPQFAEISAMCKTNKPHAVHEVINSFLWRPYDAHVSNLMYKNHGKANIKTLFHGTSNYDARQLCLGSSGFDPRVSGPGYYGEGAYFAEKLAYSMNYASRATSGPYAGRQQVIIADVCVGDCFDYKKAIDQSLRRPPQKAPKSSKGSEIEFQDSPLYDSVKGGPHSGSCMFVVYLPSQAYPR